jgi:hypothetical protein
MTPEQFAEMAQLLYEIGIALRCIVIIMVVYVIVSVIGLHK